MMYVAINLLLVFKKVAHLRRAFLLERASVTRLSKNSSVSAKLPRLWACRGHPSVSVGPVVMSPLSSFVNIPSSPPVRLGGSPVFPTVPCTPACLSPHPRAFALAALPTTSSRCRPSLCVAGTIPPGRSQLECPLLGEVSPELPGCKAGLVLLCPPQESSSPCSLADPLSGVYLFITCLSGYTANDARVGAVCVSPTPVSP